MPAVVVSNIEFDPSYGYYICLRDLREVFPHIEKDKKMELYVIELRNEQGKFIKRFKPLQKIELKTGEHYCSYHGLEKHLCLSEEIIAKFNIGKNYKIAMVIAKYDGKPFLPLELKGFGYDSGRILEGFSKLEANLLLLILEQPALNEAASYMWDAYFRLEEGDIEGSRTMLRNCLQILEDSFLPEIKVPEASEETGEFVGRLEKLLKSMESFLHYGGPHPGPAPRTTTEMMISVTAELMKYLSKALEEKVILLREKEK